MSYYLIFKKILDDLKAKDPLCAKNQWVGWTCTYLPLEILEAAHLTPFRILPEATTEKADSYLDPNFCPFIKATLEKALSGGYSFLSGIIFLNTCDGMRRLFDAWRLYCKPTFSYLLDLPRVMDSSSITFFKEGLEDLIKQLEVHFRRKIIEDDLLMAIERSNKTRELLITLFSLQGRGDPPFTHGEILDILSERWKVNRPLFNQALELFISSINLDQKAYPLGPKVMLTGSLLDGGDLVRMIEELGGEVVASELCTGQRIHNIVNLDSDPLDSLSQAYLGKPPCGRMHDTQRRIDFLKQRLLECKAQGLIYFSLKFCDPYLYEAPAIEGALKEIGIPTLFIEGEYSGKPGGGIRTRIQAFLEVLRQNG